MAFGETRLFRWGLRSLPLSAIFTTLLLSSTTNAQGTTILNPNALPSCAESCSTLTAAQSGCVPPAAPVSDRNTYVSCFCTSTLLTGLWSSPDGICDTECPDQGDRDQIQHWFEGFCNAYNPQGTTTSATPTSTTSSTSSTSSTTSSAPNPTDTTLLVTPTDTEPSGGTWISNHWQWIIFLVVLILAIVGLCFLLWWLKKRHRRRHAARSGHAPATEVRNNESPAGQIPNSSEPQMSTMSGANGSSTVVPAPPFNKTRSRTTSLRLSTHSHSPSRDSVPHMGAYGSVGRSRPPSMGGAPIVWGPHQNQAQTQGYGYRNSEMEVPTPVVTRPQSATYPSRHSSWGPQNPHNNPGAEATGASREALREEEEEDERPHTADGTVTQLAEGVRRKLSKRKQ